MLRISNLAVGLDTPHQTPQALRELGSKTLGIPLSAVLSCRLAKKSVDARQGRPVRFVLTLDVQVSGDEDHLAVCLKDVALLPPAPAIQPSSPTHVPSYRPVVVGLGPAGLFAALALCEAGVPPIILERGQALSTRQTDVARLMGAGKLNPESNILFGEGGAGAFSDGKLTTGIKSPLCRRVLEVLAAHGAPEEILWQQKPHIGTDRLAQAIPRLRTHLESLGAQVHFGARLADLITEGDTLRGIAYVQGNQRTTIEADALILAAGHSARDTLEMLHRHGVTLAQKPFSIGARIEHPQAMIDRVQYGPQAGHPALPPADYKLAVHLPNGQDVYTFCMCPGGTVVASASEPQGVCVNGMSPFARNGRNANSAVLVGVSPADFGDTHPLAGVALQRQIERAAYDMAGGNYRAPAQLVGDFLHRRPSRGPGSVEPTYQPGVAWGDLSDCLPSTVVQAMVMGLTQLDRRLKGFAMADAVLTGPETRSSSPVRIPRDPNGQASLRGLYPAGEGAGYAGGIMSAAVDGWRAALALLGADTHPNL